MQIGKTGIYVGYYKTSKRGFKAVISRWNGTEGIGGFWIRAFGRNFAVYEDGRRTARS